MKIHPSIFLGLGGTGRVAVAAIKQRLLREELILPVFKFLAIDCDRASPIDIGEVGSDLDPNKGELLIASIENIEAAEAEIKSEMKETSIKEHPIWGWYEFGVYRRAQRSSINTGAGQIRKFSRLALFWNFNTVNDRLKSISRDVTAELPKISQESGIDIELPLHFYIIASIAGGTGSGLFFDIVAMAKKINPRAIINLILLSPEFFEELQTDTGQDRDLQITNAYASLKELNYYVKTRKFIQRYPTEEEVDLEQLWRIEDTQSLRLFLLTPRNEGGFNIPSRVHMAKTICEFCLYSVVDGVSADMMSRRTDSGKIFRTWTIPYTSEEQPKAFSSFGISILSFPKKELVSILSCKASSEIINKTLGTTFDPSEVQRDIEGYTRQIEERMEEILPYLDRHGLIPLEKDRTPSMRKLEDFRKYIRRKREIISQLEQELKDVERMTEKQPISYDELLGIFRDRIINHIKSNLINGRGWNYIKGFLDMLVKEGIKENLVAKQKSYVIDPKERTETEKHLRNKVDDELRTLDRNYPRFVKKWGNILPWISNVYYAIRKYGTTRLKYKEREAIFRYYIKAAQFVQDILNNKLNEMETRLRSIKGELDTKERETYDKIKGGLIFEEKVCARTMDIEKLYQTFLSEAVVTELREFKRQVSEWLDLETTGLYSPQLKGKIKDDLNRRVEGMIKSTGVDNLHLLDPHIFSGEEATKSFNKHASQFASAFFDPGVKGNIPGSSAHSPEEWKFMITAYTQDDIRKLGAMKPEGVTLKTLPWMDRNRITFITIKDSIPIYRLGKLLDYQNVYFEHITKEAKPENRWDYAHINWDALKFPDLIPSPNVDKLFELAWKLKVLQWDDKKKKILWQGRVFASSKAKAIDKLKKKPELARNLKDDLINWHLTKGADEVSKLLDKNALLYQDHFILVDEICQRLGIERKVRFVA